MPTRHTNVRTVEVHTVDVLVLHLYPHDERVVVVVVSPGFFLELWRQLVNDRRDVVDKFCLVHFVVVFGLRCKDKGKTKVFAHFVQKSEIFFEVSGQKRWVVCYLYEKVNT